VNKFTVSSDAPGERAFLLGNEAIARGALEAGIQMAAAYPGTPSSEILETLIPLSKQFGMYVEWSTNEKVAFEVAYSASLAGLRSLCSMKHVGLNVAHDPLMTAAYIGARGGFVILVADDPFAWSSQNEQDSRYVAEQAYIPVLEPSSVAEAKDMLVDAYRLSEEFGHIFMLRPVNRVSHGRADVTLGELPKQSRDAKFIKDPGKLCYTPAQARKNRALMLERFQKIKYAVNILPYNQLHFSPGARLGIIASGLSYAYAQEALKWLGLENSVSVLKIGTPHPLPEQLVRQILSSVPEVIVVEELEPFVENHVKAIAGEANIPVRIHGKDILPVMGELSTRLVVEAICKITGAKSPVDFGEIDKISQKITPALPARPPTLCAGCPHRASQYAIKIAGKRAAREMGDDVETIFTGDIGCYTLSYLPPIESMDVVICMGAGYGLANGLSHITKVPVVAQLGDSTFFHSGIPAMVNAVFNNANITMVVLDNSATAMTGFQPHPGTGMTAMGEPTVSIKPEEVAKACGVKFVEVVDPADLKKTIATIEAAIKFPGPALVVSRHPCAMIAQRAKRAAGTTTVYAIDQQKCRTKCESCVKLLGCPAIVKEDTKKLIDPLLCTGCGLCAQICPYQAISLAEGVTK